MDGSEGDWFYLDVKLHQIQMHPFAKGALRCAAPSDKRNDNNEPSIKF